MTLSWFFFAYNSTKLTTLWEKTTLSRCVWIAAVDIFAMARAEILALRILS